MKIYYRFRTDTDEWPYPDEEYRVLVNSILEEHFTVLTQIIQEICDKYIHELEGSSFAALISYEKSYHKHTFIPIKILKGQEKAAERMLQELRAKLKDHPEQPEDIRANKN